MNHEHEQRRRSTDEPRGPSAQVDGGRFARVKHRAEWLLQYARQNKLRAGLSGVGLLLVLLIFGSVWSWLNSTVEQGAHEQATLELALAALDQRSFEEARLLAEKLRYSAEATVGDLGGALFVLGAAASYESDKQWRQDRWTYQLLAAGYLEEARDRGFPPGREAEGTFLLGRSLYHSRQFAASVPLLKESLVRYPTHKSDILKYLAGALAGFNPPDYAGALAYNERYLADPKLSATERHEGLLVRSRMLFETGEHARCRQTLELIPDRAANRSLAMVLEGRLLMRAAEQIQNRVAAGRAAVEEGQDLTAEQQSEWKQKTAEARELYRTALTTFRRAQGRDNSSNDATRQAFYLSGLCLIEMGEDDAALVQFAKARRQYGESAEGLAAAMAEADLLRRLHRDQEAMDAYRRTIRIVAEQVAQQKYHNPWLPIDEFRLRLRGIYDAYLEAERFEQAIHASDLLGMFLPHIDATRLRAEAQVALGESLQSQADSQPREKAELTRQAARKHYRQAGLSYVQLAELRIAMREYPDDLWHAAQSFLAGHDYKSSIRVFEEYLENESRRRRAQALVGMGRARLALGELDAAILALNECMQEYPKDPVTYQARLLTAEALQDKGETDEAIGLLRENIGSLHLAPESHEWRDSLFQLGRLLFADGEYREAILRLEEAVERYPEASQTLESRYLIAESYRKAAREPIEQLETVTIETNRAAAAAELRRLLNESLAQYHQVQIDLSRRSDATPLSPLEEAILRNCYFARGAIFFELGKFEPGAYEQAILAFSDATNIYQREPEVLEAFLLIAACYRRLGKPVEARGAIEQAKVVLGQLDDSQPFPDTANFNHEEWTKLLSWLSTL